MRGNVNTVRSMGDNIDVDVSAVFESSARIADLGDRLYGYVADVGSGTRDERGAERARDGRELV